MSDSSVYWESRSPSVSRPPPPPTSTNASLDLLRLLLIYSAPLSQPTQISGTLHNTGQSLVFRVERDQKLSVNISGGPLAYRYQFEEIYIHYGTENKAGSEHQIHGYAFPGEVS